MSMWLMTSSSLSESMSVRSIDTSEACPTSVVALPPLLSREGCETAVALPIDRVPRLWPALFSERGSEASEAG